MSKDHKAHDAAVALGRRRFLKGATLGGAAAIAAPMVASAQAPGAADPETAPAARSAPGPGGPPGTQRSVPAVPNQQAEQGRPEAEPKTQKSVGSDYMVEVLRSMGVEYMAAVPSNTLKAFHESIINYGMTSDPKIELLTCNHEEISVAIAHGYAKIAGKPMACMVHSAVGLQHAAMAIYNAWADRAPVICITGHQADQAKRAGVVGWAHSAFDGNALIRDFTKFDDTPQSLGHYSDAAARAYRFAMTPPYGPVVLAMDEHLQEDSLPGDRMPPVPRRPNVSPPAGEQGAVEEVARLLVAAEHPVLMADRCARTPAGLRSLVELAEALQAPVVDAQSRMNFPWRHPLNQRARARLLVGEADVILGLEMSDFYGASSNAKPTAKKISISASDAYLKSNYGDLGRYTAADLTIAADAEATLPMLVQAVKRLTPASRREALDQRGKGFATAHQAAMVQSRAAAAVGWDDQPITVARMCMELYDKIRNEDWSMVNGTVFQNYWPQQLWSADKHYQYIGDSGAYGLGYLPGASIGAALANKPHGRLTVAIGGDGDLMFTPGALWTMAHHKVPLLYVVHNNRAYHQELMTVQQMAGRMQRGVDRCEIGNVLRNPDINFAKLADAMGVHGETVTDPAQLGAAYARAIAMVKSGQPALVDVVSQGR
jgi:thiamine pyrophosphate-dependent acetolactate synthase large subunit-like protein